MRGFLYIALLAPVLAIFAMTSQSRPARLDGPVLPDGARTAVRYVTEARDNPLLHLYIVQVDLAHPGVSVGVATAGAADEELRAKGWTTTLEPVSRIAAREGFDVAVNGDFFSHDQGDLGPLTQYRAGAPAHTMGPLVSDGRVIPVGESPGPLFGLLVDAAGRCSIGEFPALPSGARQFVHGNALLVRNGKVNVPEVEAGCTARAPLTVVGLDRDGRTLTLLVVDGRRDDYSVGMTPGEAAAELVRLGCDTALNLDGGGSSTLVFRDARDGAYRVANCPSDGHQLSDALSFERPVASTLGIRLCPRPAPTLSPANH